MKKIICIACVLALIFSLTACSNSKTNTKGKTDTPTIDKSSEEIDATVKEEKIDKYINENSLSKKDNISFLLDSINDNEYHILNIKSPNEINPVLCEESFPICEEHKDNLRILEYSTERIVTIYKGCKFRIDALDFSNHSEPYQTWKPLSSYTGTIIAENEYLLAVEEIENSMAKPDINYVFWAKAKNQYIKIEVQAEYEYTHAGQIKKAFKEVQTADQALQVFNILKECFTFATVKSETKASKSISCEVPKLSTTTIFGAESPLTDVNNWVFENDLLYKEFAEKGINLATSCYLYTTQHNGANFGISATYNLELTDAERETGLDWEKAINIDIFSLQEGDSYDMGKTVKEFEIGKMKFKLLGLNDSDQLAYKIKTEKGYEFLLQVFPYGRASEYDFEYGQLYLEKIFLSN